MSGMMNAPAPAIVRRRLASPLYAAGVRQTVQLDRDGVLLGAVIRVQYRVTNGATGPVGPLWSTLARILRRVEVVVNGQDTVINVNGAHLASRQLVESTQRPLGMEASVVLTNSAVTDYDISIRVPFVLPYGAQRRDDTALDLRGVQQAILAVTWGDASDLFTTPGAAAISNVNVEITGHYLVNASPAQRYLVRALDIQDVDNTTTNANLSVLLDRGSDIFWRNLHIATLRNNVAVQNILTGDVRWQAGSFIYDNRSPREVLADTIFESRIPYSEFPAADQVYRLSRDFYGSIATLINGGALAGDLFLILGTTYTSGTERISISREFIRPLRA
jgi:hypothetical protein